MSVQPIPAPRADRERVRILLVDDHPLFRRGLAGLLATRPEYEVVGEAADGPQAVEKARALMPDVILMDLGLPGFGGMEATRRIKAELPYVKVVMLTVSDAEHDLFASVKAGAQGYLLKNLEPDEFFAYLHGVARGDAPISGAMAAKILHEFTRGEGARPEVEPAGALTRREAEVLRLVSMGMTNRAVAAELGIAENTVKNHLRNIMAKLHLDNRVQAAAYAIRQGVVPPT